MKQTVSEKPNGREGMISENHTSAPKATLFHVEPRLVPGVWHTILPGLEEAIANSAYEVSPERVKEELGAGRWLLWVAQLGGRYAGFTVTELLNSDKGVWVNLLFSWCDPQTRGAADVWGDGVKQIEGLARSMNLRGLKFLSTRKGYEKKAPRYGFTRGFVEWRKEF